MGTLDSSIENALSRTYPPLEGLKLGQSEWDCFQLISAAFDTPSLSGRPSTAITRDLQPELEEAWSVSFALKPDLLI